MTTPTTTHSPSRRFCLLPQRRPVRVLVIVLAAVAGLLLAARWIAAPVLRDRLTAMVEKRLNAKLQLGSVSYVPPYGVDVADVHLVFTDPEGKSERLLDVAQVKLRLAELPIHRGPLVIRELAINGPSVHVIKTWHGVEGETGLVKPKPPPAPDQPEPAGQKLSDLFRLEKLSVENAAIYYDDRTRPGSDSLKWGGIDVHANTTRRGVADYDFALDASHGDVTSLGAEGSINIDDGGLRVSSLHLRARADEGNTSEQVPPRVRAICEEYALRGALSIDGAGTMNLRHPVQSARYQGTIGLKDASAVWPRQDATLDRLELRVDVNGSPGALRATVRQFEAGSGDTGLRVADGAEVGLDAGARRWSLKSLVGKLDLGSDATSLPANSRPMFRKFEPRGLLEFTAAGDGPLDKRGAAAWSDVKLEALVVPRGVSLRPPGFPHPVTDVHGGPVKINGDVVTFRDLTGAYGGDQWMLTTTRLPLGDLARRVVRLHEINGSITFHRPSPDYPKGLRQAVEALRPDGQYLFAGHVTLDRNRPPTDPHRNEYDILISADHASMAPTPRQILVTEIRGDAELTDKWLEVKHARGSAFGGTVYGKANVICTNPLSYSAEVNGERMDLAEARRVLAVKESKVHVSGRADLHANLAGRAADPGENALKLMTGTGQFEVYGGDLWEIPVFKGIAGGTSAAKNALTAGDAAAVFDIKGGAIDLQDAALNSPALGLEGAGTVGMDGQLDLHVVAAPLADWEEGIKKTGIPVVSDVAGATLGAIQKLLNTATATLLYEFRVTGTVSKPEVKAIPAPALTEGNAIVFGNMLTSRKDMHPINLLNKPKKTN